MSGLVTTVNCCVGCGRFHDPWFDKYFDGDPSTGQMEQFGPLPLTHIHLMRLWKAWLEHYPEDFVNNDSMAVGTTTRTTAGPAARLAGRQLYPRTRVLAA